MPIKALAIELYRAQQQVHALEDLLAICPLDQQDQVRRELRTARAERDQLRRLIDARKEAPPFRRNFQN